MILIGVKPRIDTQILLNQSNQFEHVKKDGFELYLSNDIVQGEDIPFYLLWNDANLKEINIEYSGFTGIGELYNVKNIFSDDNSKILKSDLKKDYYLGGSLKTQKTDDPFKKSLLKIIILKEDGTTLELFEERTLFTTCLKINQTASSELFSLDTPLLNIELTGSTTIFIDVKTDNNSDLQLTLPIEIQTSMKKFMDSLMTGLNDLDLKFPNNPILDLLKDIFQRPEKLSEQQYLERVGSTIKKFEPDAEFKEALGMVFFNAVHVESNMLNLIIRPLMEYFESLAAKKVFLNSPFLTLEIFEGQNIFKGKIIYQNILEREEVQDQNPLNEESFEIVIYSDKKQIVALKDLISITRIE